MRKLILVMAGWCLTLNITVLAGESRRVLPQTIDGAPANEMMSRYLQHQAKQRFEQWRQRCEELRTPEQIAAYQKNLRATSLEAIGGMRDEDILVCARLLADQHKGPVDLVAVGHVCAPALHAAALEPALFTSVRLVRGLISWSNVIESGLSRSQLVNAVHGALATYDLPDLARILGDRLTLEQPLNALGEPVGTTAAAQ